MITEDLIVPAALALVALLVAVLLVAALVLLRREKARGRAQLATSMVENADLRARVDELARRFENRATASVEQEYVITGIGQAAEDSDDRDVAKFPERHIDGRLFADIVLRESVVKAAAFTHGVRRALAAQTRNRIRFEMKREVKRSRKERKIELRDVRRELAQRQRAAKDRARQEQTRSDQTVGRSEEVA